MQYEVGERLYWFEAITYDPNADLPVDAPERYATVTQVEEDGTVVYVRFDDGVEDWYPCVNVQDYMERVTWDAK